MGKTNTLRLVREHSQNLVRILIASALVLISVPRLMDVFKDEVSVSTAALAGVSLLCSVPITVQHTWHVKNDGSADYEFDIGPLDATAPDLWRNCDFLDLSFPGQINEIAVQNLAGETKHIPLNTVKGRFGVGLSLDLRKLGKSVRIVIKGTAPEFLLSRTYSTKKLVLFVHCNSCAATNADIFLGSAYEPITDLTKYDPVLLTSKETLIHLVEKADRISWVLSNVENSHTRDVQIVVSGMLLATALALIADFLVELASLLSRANPREEDLDTQVPSNNNRRTHPLTYRCARQSASSHLRARHRR